MTAVQNKKSLRFTKPRQRVYEALQQTKTPMKAYDVVDTLGDVKSMTVYRALDFLVKNSLAHRIESLNAYIACDNHHCHDGIQFLICNSCKNVTEIHTCHPPKSLAAQAQENNFHVTTWRAELHGTCQDCSA